MIIDPRRRDERIRKSLTESAQSWDAFQATISIYIANVQRHNFASAETERAALHEHLDNYLDQFALAGMLAHQGSQS